MEWKRRVRTRMVENHEFGREWTTFTTHGTASALVTRFEEASAMYEEEWVVRIEEDSATMLDGYRQAEAPWS
jgi:hypothetical protein